MGNCDSSEYQARNLGVFWIVVILVQFLRPVLDPDLILVQYPWHLLVVAIRTFWRSSKKGIEIIQT